MAEKRFQKRYIEKNNKVYDTWKEMDITDELNSDSLLNVLSHLNSLGEIIDRKIEHGRYCLKKYNELKDENEQLKQEIKEQKIQLNFITDQKNDFHRKLLERNNSIGLLKKENEQLKKENEHFRKVFSNKYDAYIDGDIGGNVNEQ